jgi:hypothetical protein
MTPLKQEQIQKQRQKIARGMTPGDWKELAA